MRELNDVIIAMGGNMPSQVGPPAETLRAALTALVEQGAEVRAISAFYATPCFPAGAGPDYVNAAAVIGVQGGAADALALLHRIEAEFGRERVQRWGRRTLDLDLIAAGQAVLPDRETYEAWRDLDPAVQMETTPERLIVPHPRVQDRAFVLVPLMDVAPDWCHPVLGRTVRQMAAALSESALREVVRLP